MKGAGAALLLAGGRATRLGALSERWAKACVPVGGTNALRFLLPRLLAAGHAPIWINLHHHAEQVRAEARAAAPGADLRFYDEPVLLGTGGTLLAVAQAHGALPRLILNAKVFTDFDFSRLHGEPPGTLVLHPASPLGEFGGLRFDGSLALRGLAERGAAAADAAPFTGIALPHAAWLDGLAAARAARPEAPLCNVRDGLLPALAAGVPHHALLHSGSWCEISTPERLAAAEQLLAAEI